MDSGVGTILRRARSRREVELPEVEAATRIRLRYLRAIEDEEWDVLPGGVYTRGFIRTYASFLGLDGERLVEDYREGVEPWHRADAPRSQPERSGAPTGRRGALIVVIVVLAVIAVGVAAIVSFPTGGGSGTSPARQGTEVLRGHEAPASPAKAPVASAPDKRGVTVRLAASAEIWACLVDAKGKALVNGLILEAGAEAGPFHSGSFTVSFGNGEVKMLIDGREAQIPQTSSPIGYAIDSAGRLTKLGEAERPTCA